jgi:cytochrome c biogenesis protein CcdA
MGKFGFGCSNTFRFTRLISQSIIHLDVAYCSFLPYIVNLFSSSTDVKTPCILPMIPTYGCYVLTTALGIEREETFGTLYNEIRV